MQEWPKPKAAIQIRFHLKPAGRDTERGSRERESEQREGLSVSLLPNPENLTKEKRRSVGAERERERERGERREEGERDAEESRGISEDIFFFPLLYFFLLSPLSAAFFFLFLDIIKKNIF